MKIPLDKILDDHIEAVDSLRDLSDQLNSVGEQLVKAISLEKKIFIAGNGGSAADAQHFAAELTGRFLKERISLPAIALTTDTSAITAISNDYGYKNIFSRQLEGLSNNGDIFIGISTSGNSDSINLAGEYCKNNKIKSIGLLGRDGGEAKSIFNESIIVPSFNTANIQECHILILHFLCMILDESF